MRSLSRKLAVFLVACLFVASGCSSQSAKQLSGVWRSEGVSDDSNLVLEFVPDGSGQVFSGASIGLPSDGSFTWRVQGNQIKIEAVGDESIIQVMEILSQEENRLSVEVNRTQFSLIRVDDVISDDALDLPSLGN